MGLFRGKEKRKVVIDQFLADEECGHCRRAYRPSYGQIILVLDQSLVLSDK